MMDSFQRVMENDRGIYVVCSDKALLDRINKMLRRQGVVGVTDGEGKLHYMVDARSSAGGAARQVGEIISSAQENAILGSKGNVPEEVATYMFDDVVDSVFAFYELDRALIGTKILKYLVRYLFLHSNKGNISMKELYLHAGWELHQNYAQIERNIRYAIGKSKFAGMKVKTINLLHLLLEAVRLGLSEKHIK